MRDRSLSAPNEAVTVSFTAKGTLIFPALVLAGRVEGQGNGRASRIDVLAVGVGVAVGDAVVPATVQQAEVQPV
jgi:hypothetical protein